MALATDNANFAAALAARAATRPRATALIEPDRRAAAHWRSASFGELDTLADRYAVGLARTGVRRGDRVLYVLRPSIVSYAVFYALLRLAAVPVLLDPRMGLRRLLACVEAVRPRVVVAVPLLHALRAIARAPFAATELNIASGPWWLPGCVSLRACIAGSADGAPSDADVEGECFLPFTSGSTGPPKGVRYTHDMLRAQLRLIRDVCGWQEGMRVVMCYAPFVPYALADGLTVILPDMDFSRPARARPARVAAAIRDHDAMCAFASPIVWLNLVRYFERSGTTLPSLERAVTAGAPVPVDLPDRLHRLMHRDGRLFTPYGATEAMPVTTADSVALTATVQHLRQGYGTCVGKALPGIDVRVIRVTDDAIPFWSDDLPLAAGEIGELVVGGAIVSPEYVGRPLDTARAKIRVNGAVLHRTGDLGRIDVDGRVWFCGRKADRLETAAGMVAPVPLENLLNQHPRVFRTAVVGVGPRGAQTAVACVELEPGEKFSPRLARELAALVADSCWADVVRHFLPHPGLPMDARHNSKIRYDEMRAWAARRVGIRVVEEARA